MVDAFEGELALDGLADENLQARVRGVILMAISNREGHLVLATGQQVGARGRLLDDLRRRASAATRPQGRRQVAGLEAVRGGATTPRSTRGEIPPDPGVVRSPSRRRPSFGPGRWTRTRCRTYDLLDEVLDAYVENAEGRRELLARGFDPAVVDKVLTLVDRAEWKRRQYPLGTKVTALAFGRDRRLPITTGWREA